MSKLMKVHAVGAEILLADRWTDRYGEGNSLFRNFAKAF